MAEALSKDEHNSQHFSLVHANIWLSGRCSDLTSAEPNVRSHSSED